MNTKRKVSFGVVLSTLLIVLVFSISINAVYAYFSTSASKDISFKYATLAINVTDASTGEFATTTNETFKSLIPGDTISFSDVTISNSGTADCYVLVKLKIDVADKSYVEWYNLGNGTTNSAQIIADTSNVTTGATYIAKSGASGNSATFNLNWTLPGEDIDNNYQGVTVKASITVYAIQAYLPDNTSTTKTDAVYASEFILNNYANFNEN